MVGIFSVINLGLGTLVGTLVKGIISLQTIYIFRGQVGICVFSASCSEFVTAGSGVAEVAVGRQRPGVQTSDLHGSRSEPRNQCLFGLEEAGCRLGWVDRSKMQYFTTALPAWR